MISWLSGVPGRHSAGGVLPPHANEVRGGEGWGGGWCFGHHRRSTNHPPPPTRLRNASAGERASPPKPWRRRTTPPRHSLREWEEGRHLRRWRCFIFASVVVAAL